MSGLVLSLTIVFLHVYWIYHLVNYDWTNFEEDQKQAIKDFF